MAFSTPEDVQSVRIDPAGIEAFLGVPSGASGLVIFAHGSGSGRFSPRNNRVAAALREAGLATLLVDLLRPEEEQDRRNVFDIDLLADRLVAAKRWVTEVPEILHMAVGYFGASTGAGAALQAAYAEPDVGAVVSRGGRPDLAIQMLPGVRAPTLLLVGSLDGPVIEMNQRAFEALTCEKRLIIIDGAGHLFEEPGTMDQVIRHATDWFLIHLGNTQRGI
ncbi:dienelactone hydrolase family protein [Sinorhizobium terangae]|uniref:dienelactone hydrolase family protein n=1 Tax=Sinorhizobium terangae TaxID=110322 RepID=UPI0024B0F4F3|nr:dienelactone hydrolase family protein [Sinorhizobium terangae]WFU47964.1 dienelactone hydrolase family protein [Sinorhizobium terangae]